MNNFIIIIENTELFHIFSRDLCYRQRCWGPGALNERKRSGACLAHTPVPSLSTCTPSAQQNAAAMVKAAQTASFEIIITNTILKLIFKSRCYVLITNFET